MAQISITIPDAMLTRVVNGIAKFHGYQAFLEDSNGNPTIPNPETREQFTRRMVIVQIKNWVKNVESEDASRTARDIANTNVDSIGIT